MRIFCLGEPEAVSPATSDLLAREPRLDRTVASMALSSMNYSELLSNAAVSMLSPSSLGKHVIDYLRMLMTPIMSGES